jgi:hypothetical protein
MRKMYPAIVAAFALLTFVTAPAVVAGAAKKQPVSVSGACKPSDSGTVYRNYIHCVDHNKNLGAGTSISKYCSRFCKE